MRVTCSLALSVCWSLLVLLVSSETIYWENHTESGDYVVQDGVTLVLRGQNSVTGSLQVAAGGQLTVDDQRETFLLVGNIEIFGSFHIGTRDAPYTKKAIVELSCGSQFLAADDRRKSIVVGENGSILLFGEKGASSKTWTKLRDTAHAGDSCLDMDLPSGWQVGDEIVLPTTDFDPHQAEKRKITAITPTCVHIDTPLQYMHYGRVTEGVDERGEVGLLTRSITFRGCHEAADASDVGGHMVFMDHFRQVQAQGIELVNFGQGDQLGRYPMHFHLCGQVPHDTFLRFNAIHDSNFRAITLHGTQGVLVEGNVAFNITGHAFMLEDGAESDNVIRNNLIVLVQEKVTNVRLGSDAQISLSAFYITNTNNTITDNVVAGVEGTAFWIHTRLDVKGQSFRTGQYNGIHPFKLPLGDMRRNAAHGVEVGFKIDSPDTDALDYPQQKYSPSFTYMPDVMPVIRDFTVHHSRQGAWLRLLRVVLDNWTVGDVTEGVQVLTRGDTSSQSMENYITNSLFVGSTGNRGNLVQTKWQFINYLENRSDSAVDRTDNARMAIKLYDGPMHLSNCTFTHWYSQPCLGVVNPALGTRLYNTFAMSTSIVASELTFDKTDVKLFVSDREADGGKTSSMVDKLGTISGVNGATLLPDWDYYATPHCVKSAQFGLACPHRYANLDIISVDTNTDPSRFGTLQIYRNSVETNDASLLPPSLAFAGQYIPAARGWLYHPIVSPDASYTIQFERHTPETLKLVFSNARMDDVFRVAVLYPPSTEITHVINQDGESLTQMASRDDMMCSDCYWYDASQSVLVISVKERADPSDPSESCPPIGCLSVEVHATVPIEAGVSNDEAAGILMSLQVVQDAWVITQFTMESEMVDTADNVDWCQVDDPCLHGIDAGNAKMGILAYRDSPCNGVGCFSDTCRYCKLTISSADVPFGSCPFDPSYVAPSNSTATVCDEFVSVGNTNAGIIVLEDSQCAGGGIGCITTQCRYCKTPQNTGSTYLDCSLFQTSSTGSSSSSPTTAATGTASTPSSLPLLPSPPSVISDSVDTQCLTQVPKGDLAAGIGAIEDFLCQYGGLGCFSLTCRYCRTSNTPQASHFLPCSTDAIHNAYTATGNVAARDPTNLCWQFVSPGDSANGVTAVVDNTCQYGGLGCLSTTCRFCSATGSPESAPYMPCDGISATAISATAVGVPVATTTVVEPPASSPEDPCRGLVSSGDVAAGITAVTQTSCGTLGGVGCVTDTCRFCKTRVTQQSVHLSNCTDLMVSSSTTYTTADKLLEAAAASLSSSSVVASIDTCSHMVSLQENIAGIFGFTDFRCSAAAKDTTAAKNDEVGCFSDKCRYCRTEDALDIFSDDDGDAEAGDSVDDFMLCPLYVVASSMGDNPSVHGSRVPLSCSASVSLGDSQSGISAFVDPSCNDTTTNDKANNGCFAREPCRFCKYRETKRSASIPWCPSIREPYHHQEGVAETNPQPCSEIPRILQLVNVSARHEPRCNAASPLHHLTGCIAFTTCRICKTASDDGNVFKTAYLPMCSSLDDLTTLAVALSSEDGNAEGNRSAVTWSTIIVVVVGIACAVAVIAIIYVKRRERNRQGPIMAPHHLPRPHDGQRVSVARITSDFDFFVL